MGRTRKILASSVEAGRAWARYWDTKSESDLRRALDLEESAHEERLEKPELVREDYLKILQQRLPPFQEE